MLQAESDERAERSAADEVADLTAASSVLPGMFTWLGSQQKMSVFPLLVSILLFSVQGPARV